MKLSDLGVRVGPVTICCNGSVSTVGGGVVDSVTGRGKVGRCRVCVSARSSECTVGCEEVWGFMRVGVQVGFPRQNKTGA